MIITMTISTRINLALPMDLSIQIEKECARRGIQRTQLIKEVLYEKLQKKDLSDEKNILLALQEEIHEIKKALVILIELNKKAPASTGAF